MKPFLHNNYLRLKVSLSHTLPGSWIQHDTRDALMKACDPIHLDYVKNNLLGKTV